MCILVQNETRYFKQFYQIGKNLKVLDKMFQK